MNDKKNTQFPHVSSGSLSGMLLEKVLQSQKKLKEIEYVRSKDAVNSLHKKKIDLAIVHRSSITDYQGLSICTLLKWNPVLVSASYGNRNDFKTIVWDEGSFADILLTKFKNASPISSSEYFGNKKTRKGQSFLNVLELIRRELPYQVVIPDIYLTKHDINTLFINNPDETIQDELVAIFREADRERLNKFLDKESWEKVFIEHSSSKHKDLNILHN